MLGVVASTRQGILATLNRAGYPHLTNMLYTWDEPSRTALFMTTAERVKVRHLRDNPRAALHVSGGDFWSFVVGEGQAVVSEPSLVPGDPVGRELLLLHPEIEEHDHAAFFKQMVVDQRLLIRLTVTKFYGTALDI